MPQFLLLMVIALVVAALVFGIGALVTGADPGLVPAVPDDGARGLPGNRPLVEEDLHRVRFDTGFRGYRMSQVDTAVARAAYDIGFKQEMIEALRAEVTALREGRTEDADVLRKARETASGEISQAPEPADAKGRHDTSSGDRPAAADAGEAATPEPVKRPE